MAGTEIAYGAGTSIAYGAGTQIAVWLVLRERMAGAALAYGTEIAYGAGTEIAYGWYRDSVWL
eukprot:2186553-Rhodomonas_salina.1